MDRIIGIDYGRKRVGVAVSDPLRIFASALETVQTAKIIEYLKKYAESETIVRFVVGYPVNMNGTIGERAEKTLAFKEMLERRTGLPIVMWDERLTTVAADRVLIEAGVRRENRKGYVDEIAAVFILQGYLDSKGMENGEN